MSHAGGVSARAENAGSALLPVVEFEITALSGKQMQPRSDHRLLTAEEFFYEQPDERRSELIAGEVVREPPPAPEHGLLAVNVAHHLRKFLEVHCLGRVLAESGYVL